MKCLQLVIFNLNRSQIDELQHLLDLFDVDPLHVDQCAWMAALTQDGLEEGAEEGQHHPVGMDHLAIITGQGDICEVGVKEKLLEEFVRERVQI